MPQSSCTNDTAAPLRQRCWISAGMYNDFGLVGQDVDRYLFVPNNYTVWLLNTMYACNAILPEECIASLGPVGCLYSKLSQSGQAPPSPSAVPLPGRIALTPVLAGSLAGGAGLVAIVLTAMGLLMWWRRRQRLAVGSNSYRTVSRSGTTRSPGTLNGQSTQKDQRDYLSGPGPEFDLEGTDEDTNTQMAMPGREAYGVGPRLDTPSSDLHVVVTPLTPPRLDLALGVACGNEVTLLPIVRGKGSFGRVHEGMYGGQRVAVKLLPCDLLTAPEPAVYDAVGGSPAAACPPAGGAKQPDEAKVEGEGIRQPREQAARALDTFTQEVEVLGRCQHPNVVRLLAACLDPPQPCLVMELMETSLDRLVHAKGAPLLAISIVRMNRREGC
ncbi:hypothetical protein Vafri_4032 [Volvox africanus]|uniref:Protein kinase domain-containing protein n=2 Tax=Volvox africanus TaxID=51714 RepID=A0A8J4ATA2_9CHLO|nr:hypothetical protein Vafri_4032 [Volvox africanus]